MRLLPAYERKQPVILKLSLNRTYALAPQPPAPIFPAIGGENEKLALVPPLSWGGRGQISGYWVSSVENRFGTNDSALCAWGLLQKW